MSKLFIFKTDTNKVDLKLTAVNQRDKSLSINRYLHDHSPVLSSSQQVGGDNRTALSSYTRKTGSSCLHKMETAGLPSG